MPCRYLAGASPIFTGKTVWISLSNVCRLPPRCPVDNQSVPLRKKHPQGHLQGIFRASGYGLQMPGRYSADSYLIDLGNCPVGAPSCLLAAWPQLRCPAEFLQFPSMAGHLPHCPILIHRPGAGGNVFEALILNILNFRRNFIRTSKAGLFQSLSLTRYKNGFKCHTRVNWYVNGIKLIFFAFDIINKRY